MKNLSILIVAILAAAISTGAQSGQSEDQVMQKSLDDACERAKETEQAILRRRIFDVCKSKGREDVVCNREADQFGSMRIRSQDPTRDISVCEQALKFRKAHGGAE